MMEESGLKSVLYNSRITIISGIILPVFNAGLISGFCDCGWFHWFCSFMEFDRTLILKGEIWRLVTCHFVHWSPEHFYLDGIVFILQGITFEQKIGRKYWMVLSVSAASIGISILIFRHDLMFYRGISGLINTQLVLGAGLFIFDKMISKNTRTAFVICFAVHMTKITYETINGVPFFSTHLLGDMGLFTPVAHLSGIITGFLFLGFYISRLYGRGNKKHVFCGHPYPIRPG